MSWDLLQRFFESDVFNSSPFLSVSYLSRYADHVGIHYVLCQKLRQFPYEEIEFFLPQLCHLIISIDNESMALEEFLLGLCEESVTATLLTFWLFQTYLHDLSSNPQSGAFQTCRRVFNKVQHVVFGLPDGGARPVKIRENVLPVVVLSSFVLASVGLPLLPRWAGPLAVAQARKPSDPAAGNLVAEPRDSGADIVRVQRAHTVTAATSTRSDRGRRGKDAGRITSAPDFSPSFPLPSATSLSDLQLPRPGKKKKNKNTDTDADTDTDTPTLPARSTTLPVGPTTLSVGSTATTTPNTTKKNTTATAESRRGPTPDLARKVSHLDLLAIEGRLSSSSLPLPDLRSPRVAMMISRPATPASAGPRPADHARRHSHHQKPPLDPTELGLAQRTRLLRQHYFRSETQFLTALEGISNRLVVVPKPARLSALRAELALLARDLPAEIDVPVICPPTLADGEPGRSRHHRIVRLNPAEATVLNSAEKVPYLLMVEILRDDFSFDPNSTDNQRLLGTLLSEGGAGRRIFDLSDSPGIPLGGVAAAVAPIVQEPAPIADSVFEPVAGDLANSPMLNAMVAMAGEQDGQQQQQPQPQPASSRYQNPSSSSVTLARPSLPRSQSQSQSRHISSTGTAAATLSDAMMMIMAETATTKTTLRTWTGSTSGSGPGSAFSPALPPGPVSGEPQDFSALATHMRTASQMLAQLEATSGKRPRHEVAAIRSKIIASMQSLEERSFDMDDGHGPTFDTIMARAAASAATARPVSLDADDDHDDDDGGDDDDENGDNDDAGRRSAAATNLDPGLARMENDIKTGGIQRKGDRDDPSAAVFGEAWDAKKARIRRTSPYGWMKNWDLVSVIVKTGADLRQEAFACQLISVCHKIWLDAGVDVWVRLMRILVTGESSGLIETITNGVSLHSIKRNLTLSSIEAGQNPRRRIATLKDHFLRTFGPEAGGPHRAGVDAFKRSLAAYSIISYVLQLKDRHNGNVLIDSEGHIVHIDFGFMLSNSPGSVGFEAAPFKLTHEYVEVLGGVGSAEYEGYKSLCKKAYQALRRSADNIIDLVAMVGRDSKMPCFAAGAAQATATLRQRFQLHLSADEAEQFVEADLIGKSLGSYYTRLYDTFQYRTQGIY